MKLKTEISPENAPEIIIRAPSLSDEVLRLQSLLEEALSGKDGLALYDSGAEYYIPYRELIFFEASGGKVYAHTGNRFYTCQATLSELCDILPRSFVRASKSCLVNTARVFSVKRSPSGLGEVAFTQSSKKAYVSRMYFRSVKDAIEETRLKK